MKKNFILTKPVELLHSIEHLSKAFTLAEVLITLAIIGIVAAMTIPTLITKYQEKATVTRLTKAYATVSNAYAMARAENGELSTWGFKGGADYEKDEETGDIYYSPEADSNAKLFWDKLSPYLKVTRQINSDWNNKSNLNNKVYSLSGLETEEGYAQLNLTDGTTLLGGWIENLKCTDQTSCGDFGIDINGLDTPPNTIGKDIFFFYIYESGLAPIGRLGYGRTFDINCDRKNSTDKYNGYGCAAWVIDNKNMDYMHCDDLSWDGKHKCD